MFHFFKHKEWLYRPHLSGIWPKDLLSRALRFRVQFFKSRVDNGHVVRSCIVNVGPVHLGHSGSISDCNSRTLSAPIQNTSKSQVNWIPFLDKIQGSILGRISMRYKYKYKCINSELLIESNKYVCMAIYVQKKPQSTQRSTVA